jgi:predicted metal-dependent hydrolase
MKKSERIETFVAGLGGGGRLHPCYEGWFTCFNAGDYYEAHDVLEHLWLRTRGGDALFFKGLIQLAGAFVHLKKQHARPSHAKDGARLRPAARLFALALKNLAPFAPSHLRLDVRAACALCEEHLLALEAAAFSRNPWRPDALPAITLRDE